MLVNVWFWFHLIKRGNFASILAVYPTLAPSHFNFHAEILKTLAKPGHQVTMISPFSLPRPHENLTIINSIKGRKIDIKLMSTALRIDNSRFTTFLNGLNYWREPDCYHIMAMEEVKVSFSLVER